MSCIINTGYAIGCRDSLGSVKSVFIGSFSGATTFTYDADDVITGVTNANTLYTYEQRQEQAEFVETGNHSVENGTNFWESNLNMIFTRNDSTLRNSLKLLGQSRLLVVILDANGRYFVMGESNGADLTASSVTTGKGFGDMNGTTITLMAKEKYPSRELSAAAFASLTIV